MTSFFQSVWPWSSTARDGKDKPSSPLPQSSDTPRKPKPTHKHDSAVSMPTPTKTNMPQFINHPHPNTLGLLPHPSLSPVAIQQTSPLLTLPAELRNQIYEHVFQPSNTTHTSTGHLIPSADSIRNLGLLFTCRQVYNEAIALAYAVTFSVTNRWHAADLKDMRAQLCRLAAGLGEGGAESTECGRGSRESTGFVGVGMGEGREGVVRGLPALLEMREIEFAGHLRIPCCPPENGGKLVFMDAIVDYVRFVFNVLALWKRVRRISIWKEGRSAESFAMQMKFVLSTACLTDLVVEDHEILCDKAEHEGCKGEFEAGAWKVCDELGDENEMEAVFWIVRVGRKGDVTSNAEPERKVEIRCLRSS